MHGGGGESLPVSLWVAALIVVACVALSAFFSGSETAMTAASRARMNALEKAGDRRAATVMRLLTNRATLIGGMLLGNTIVNIGASAFMTNVLVGLFGDKGVLIATGVMTLLLLVFAEVMPKTVAITYPDQVSLLFARVVAIFVGLFRPILVAVDGIVGAVLRLFGLKIGEHTSILSGTEELKSAVDLLHREGGVDRSERDMFGGVLELGDLAVSDVMVHRTKMRMVNADAPPADIVQEVLSSPYTRLPLWRDQPDNIVGLLHAKDLLRALSAVKGDMTAIRLDEIMLEPWFVPDTTTLDEQLQAFLKRKTHFALVVDEYGVVLGLVTLEDILEEIVGDIRDEHDVAMSGVRPQGDGSVLVDGSVPIRDLNRVMDWSLPDEEATTIAGLVIHEARQIPEPGQVFQFHGFRFEVMRRTRNRLTALRVMPLASAEIAGN